MKNKSVAIIGSGISGLACSYFLSNKYDFHLYEKNNYLGGHSNTVNIKYDEKDIAVDTGFIVFNHKTYPNLKEFFNLLKVDYEESNMSFAAKIDEGKIEYAGTNLSTVFAQKKNLFNLKFLRMLKDILAFNKKAIEILEKDFDASYTLENLMNDLRLKEYFREYYLLPMSGAIWSCPLNEMLKYPAQSFVRFFENHGLLTVANQPKWYTVTGGSKNYVQKIKEKIGNNFTVNSKISKIKKTSNNKWQIKSGEEVKFFDKVIIAAHGDQVLDIIENPNKEILEVFKNFKYQPNLAILHKDQSIMPKAKKAWSSWVYANNSGNLNNEISVTYWMNNLQNIDKNYPLFVTLNPNQKIKEEDIFAKINYEHPIFDENAVKAQDKISEIQGVDNLYFCGAYQKYGFHEDGISSAIKVLNLFGIQTPWQK